MVDRYNKKIQKDYIKLEKRFRQLTSYIMEISREYDTFFRSFTDVLLKKQLEINKLKEQLGGKDDT